MKWALYLLTGGAALCGVMALTAAAKADARKAEEARTHAVRKQS